MNKSAQSHLRKCLVFLLIMNHSGDAKTEKYLLMVGDKNVSLINISINEYEIGICRLARSINE